MDEDFFIPEALVKLALKVAEKFEICNYNLFSILDTLNFALKIYYNSNQENDDDWDEKEIIILIINIIRLSEKFNNQSSKLTKLQIDKAFGDLDISRDEINNKEFKHFSLIGHEFKNPEMFEKLQKHFENLEGFENNEIILENAIDILKLFYCHRLKIFDQTKKTRDVKLLSNTTFISASVLSLAIEINTSEVECNKANESLINELEDTYTIKDINNLSELLKKYISIQ